MTPALLLALYSLAVVGASLLGGALPRLCRLSHTRLEILVSFVAGVMLGVALLHLFPLAAHTLPAGTAAGWLLAGLLGMFFLERFFCWHHHPVPGDPAPTGAGQRAHALTWGAALLGLSVHTLAAGTALAAAVEAEWPRRAWPGMGTFLVVFLHRPLDALTVAALMAREGAPPRRRHQVNLAFALVVPVGMGGFHLGADLLGEGDSTVVAGTLAAAAGVFLCLALSDILPELQFHRHDRWKLSAALLLGLALVAALGLLEAAGEAHRP